MNTAGSQLDGLLIKLLKYVYLIKAIWRVRADPFTFLFTQAVIEKLDRRQNSSKIPFFISKH